MSRYNSDPLNSKTNNSVFDEAMFKIKNNIKAAVNAIDEFADEILIDNALDIEIPVAGLEDFMSNLVKEYKNYDYDEVTPAQDNALARLGLCLMSDGKMVYDIPLVFIKRMSDMLSKETKKTLGYNTYILKNPHPKASHIGIRVDDTLKNMLRTVPTTETKNKLVHDYTTIVEIFFEIIKKELYRIF